MLSTLLSYHPRPKSHQHQAVKRFIPVFLLAATQGTPSMSPHRHTCVAVCGSVHMHVYRNCCESQVLLIFIGFVPH